MSNAGVLTVLFIALGLACQLIGLWAETVFAEDAEDFAYLYPMTGVLWACALPCGIWALLA